MSAAEQQIFEDDAMLGGSPVPPVVLPGQIDPRSVHYFYSAGERLLAVRARECGHSSIPPGFLVPLRPFNIRVPNDTVESLFDANAPKDILQTVEPRDSADGLMTRYQHRGGRILFPLTGMDGVAGAARALRLFSLVHPKIVCPRSPKALTRQCVKCRLADLGEAALDRMEKANLSTKENIPYGLTDEGTLRYISDEEAVTILHQLITSANQEIHAQMVETLQVSDADVKAGRTGPGKKKLDKRDEWYLLNTHMTADTIQAGEPVSIEPANSVGDIVSQTLKAVRDNAQAPVDVNVLLAAQEEKHQKELVAMEKRILASFAKAKKTE